MVFDACEHKIRQVAIQAAILLRQARGLPEEKNITILFNEIAPLLGITIIQMSSKDAPKLPAPHEMVNSETRKPLVPRRNCPQCSGVETVALHPICKSCKDSEDGKYKTMWKCESCGYTEKSEDYLITWLERLGVDFRSGTKAGLRIETVTDQGLR